MVLFLLAGGDPGQALLPPSVHVVVLRSAGAAPRLFDSGRVDGEELAALLPETELDVAREVANPMREATESLRVASGQDDRREAVKVTMSIGVAQLNYGRPGGSGTFRLSARTGGQGSLPSQRSGKKRCCRVERSPALRAVV